MEGRVLAGPMQVDKPRNLDRFPATRLVPERTCAATKQCDLRRTYPKRARHDWFAATFPSGGWKLL